VSGFGFLEAPRWHQDRIWFSDFYTYRVVSAREDGSDLRTEAEVPRQPAGLGWLPDGRLLVVSMVDRKVLRREADGTLVTHADLTSHATGHANDMVRRCRGPGLRRQLRLRPDERSPAGDHVAAPGRP
jgi:sugar lactone lactonase YvrE